MAIMQDFYNKEYWKGGNHKRFIIIHHTGSPEKTTLWNMLRYFRQPDDKSVHYVIGKNGNGVQMVRDDDRAWHCGRSAWGSWKNLNHSSIGIEVLSDGKHFTNAQRKAVVKLCSVLCKKYSIPISNILRHADIALPKGRKWDVGPEFYERTYGSWYGFQDAVQNEINKLK